MRVSQHLFDYGSTGVVAISTSSSAYGAIPAEFGVALLSSEGTSTDLVDLCTRSVELDAQKTALAALRATLARAVAGVHKQLDWAEARMSANFREMPTHAGQMGGNLLLLAFVGAIEPRTWRLVDVASRRVVWESDSELLGEVSRANDRKLGHLPFASDSQLLLSSGAESAELQVGMSRPILVLDRDRLEVAKWSLRRRDFDDTFGMRTGMLSQPSRKENVFALVDPRTGKASKSFHAPTKSKDWARPATTPNSDRIAISHKGGTVDIVDGIGETHFSTRPFPRLGRSEQLAVRFSNDAQWLGAEGWEVFRAVNLAAREVAELPVPSPNMRDDSERVLYDRDVLATGHGVAVIDNRALSVHRYSDLRWEPVLQPAKAKARKATRDYKQFLDQWRKPALSLAPAKNGRSWLYGSPDLRADEVPCHEGRPMRLLARIDLEEAASLVAAVPWPTAGALYFFTAVDAEGNPLEDDHFNLAATRVLWCHVSTGSTDAPDHAIAPKIRLKLAAHKADVPDIGAAIVQAATLSEGDLESYRAWLERNEIAAQPHGHRLGGYPTILQRNDLEAQAAHIADQSSFPPRDLAEKSAAARWRLLLQLDSDDVCMWGTDSGMLYFLIRDDDLARQDFSRVVSVCEGR